MAFFKSLPENAGPRNIFAAYPDLYRPWSEMSQTLMNGPSPLSQGERELILAFAAGVAGCRFVYVAHSEVAYAWGIERGVLDQLLADIGTAAVDKRLKPLLAYVRKLVLAPHDLVQADADAVMEAGWDEHALHDAIAVTARAAFMQRLVEGHGFTPLAPDVAVKHAKQRVDIGYYNVFTSVQAGKKTASD